MKIPYKIQFYKEVCLLDDKYNALLYLWKLIYTAVKYVK